MRAHFFDINTLIQLDSKVWIVSKKSPNSPILKINQSDFNLIKKGIFQNTGVPVIISNKQYFIPSTLYDEIKIKCKKANVDITSLSFSMQEFMNPEIIESLNYKIWKEHLLPLKNSPDDIYLICSKNTENNYKKHIEKLNDILFELGLKFKNLYFISETFYNRDEDEISHKKIRLILQHLIGLKTEVDKFTNEEISKYEEISFYDDEIKSISLSISINDLLKLLYENSDEEVKLKIKDRVDENLVLNSKQVTFNKVNPFVSNSVNLSLNKVIKTFEGFNWRF